MLAKNPRDRYQSASELAAALDIVMRETQQHRVRPVEADLEQRLARCIEFEFLNSERACAFPCCPT